MTLHPPASSQSKWGYRVGFLLCGVVLCVLTVWQTQRSNTEQDALREEAHSAALKSEGDLGFIRGQLASISEYVKNPPKGVSVSELAEAVGKMGQARVGKLFDPNSPNFPL